MTMERKRKWELREANARAWAGDTDVFPVAKSLDSSLKKNTAFIKRLRTAITAASLPTFLSEIKALSLHKYLSEVISASYEGLCRLKTPGEVSAGVEVISALHQRFGGADYTRNLGWHVGRGLSTPDKSQLKQLSTEAKEKEERERLSRQRPLLRLVTELWLVGVLRSLDDISRPEEAGAVAKSKDGAAQEKSKLGEAVNKRAGSKTSESSQLEPFPLEVLKDMLGHDREHTHLPQAVMFVKTFAWDVLGIQPTEQEVQKTSHAEEVAAETPDFIAEDDEPDQPEDDATHADAKSDVPPLAGPELQQRFKNILVRYFEDVKAHVIRDHKTIQSQGKRNAEAYVKSGEIFEDRQANYDKQLKAQDKLMSNAQILADVLGQEMPDLKEKESLNTSGTGGIGLVKAGEVLRAQGDGAGIWEDDEERRFYENTIDLQERVPLVLLEEPKKKKTDDAPVGKRIDESEAAKAEEKDTKQATAEDESTTTSNKNVGAQVDALLIRLPELQTKDQVDVLATDFCFLNSKASRNRLLRALEEVPKGRSDLFPLYSRLVATLGRYMPDLSSGLISYLDDEFRSLQRRKQKDFLGSVRLGNIRYLAELTKFGVVPEHVIFHCLKVSLEDFTRMNIEIIANLLESCGRYLLRHAETAPRMASFLETVQRKKAAQHLGQQERLLLENAMYFVNPPERAAIERKEKSPMEAYVTQMIYLELNKRTYPKVLKSLRKLHWEEPEIVRLLEKVFCKPWKVKYSNIYLLAVLVGSLHRYHQEFSISVIDSVLENITVGLEQNEFKYNQKRLAEMRYLGELYNFKMVDSSVIFNTLYRVMTFGYPAGMPSPDKINDFDLPDDFFRIRLVCTMLDTCGVCFDRGASRKKLDFFLTFFQYYIRTKDNLPMDIDFILQDTFTALRPQWKIATTFDEAGEAFAEMVKQNYKAQDLGKVMEAEEPEELLSDVEGDGDDDDLAVPDMDEARSSDEEADHDVQSGNEDQDAQAADSDFDDEEIIVTRQEVERDPEAEAEFDREFQKMMTESIESRKFDRRQMFDVPLPMRRAPNRSQQQMATTSPNFEDTGVEGNAVNDAAEPSLSAAPPTQTMAFSLMTKKGSKQQTRTIEMPSDSHFAVAMRNQQEAEREEQQRIKTQILSLNSMQQEDSTRRGPDEGQSFSGVSQPAIGRAMLHNAAKAAEKSSTTKRGERARKLQLSDVDWT